MCRILALVSILVLRLFSGNGLSLNKERISSASPYSVAEGTLDECIQRQFTSKPFSQQHLYEIHTAPQGELVTAVLSAKQIIELVRLRDFL